ncbi:hypothetical protein SBRCBS47491_007508 [Sporothrix bragantina]|uniref:Xaa-Pro dipeptidyl-peptidase C-terminal domain-containing protein n=1 Tax=Sporothrix bragantina TaxID=671064 RepID=A0ABP0CEF8_9PEZI
MLSKGTVVAEGHQALLLNILLEEDVAIVVGDGVTIYADVSRPANTHEAVPAVICGGPFGKNGGSNDNNFNNWPGWFGCPRIATSGLEKFEGLDPARLRHCAQGDNLEAMCYKYPTWDDYWEKCRPDFDRIQCLLYIVASWTNALHTAGTLRAWQKVNSKEKWLRVHNSHGWPELYDPQSREDLRKFYDYYMEDVVNDWPQTPTGRLSIPNHGGRDIVNCPEPVFPLARQQELKLYLDADSRSLSKTTPYSTSSFSHATTEGASVFNATFTNRTELVGYMKLRLWAGAEGSDDKDIFVLLQKVDMQFCATGAGTSFTAAVIGHPTFCL